MYTVEFQIIFKGLSTQHENVHLIAADMLHTYRNYPEFDKKY